MFLDDGDAKIGAAEGIRIFGVAVTSMETRRRVGEVIVSHTERVEVQCYELHSPPPLGALLRIGSPAVYAVVRDIWHEPLDPSRPLAARGADLETEDEIYAQNPQLRSVLTTRFTATVTGYADGLDIRQGLPSVPPNLHSFVFRCEDAEVASFVRQLQFLRLLIADGSLTADLAMTAFLQRSSETVADRRGFLIRAGRMLATELAGESQRLYTMLREIAV